MVSESRLRPVGSVEGNGRFQIDVVGESNYQDALNQIVGPKDETSVELVVEAVLVPEPENPYDANAVAVFIHSFQVGYLSRRNAKIWNVELEAMGVDGCALRVSAMITGGWKRPDGHEGDFGVKLDLPVK